jgi:hypothetical protein
MSRAKLLLIAVFFLTLPAYSYPEFVGYGYNSCLSCHFNGNGGGPLNDYGRALFSAEIASRLFYSKKTTDEEIAAQSGFLGGAELPYWLRPHVKYRGLEVRTNPGSSVSDQSKYYQMQSDFGLTIQDKKSKYLGTFTFGRLVPAAEYGLGKQGLDHIMAEEYFLRVEIAKTWWIYAGLMEKVYGLRNIDHSSYQRTYQGFNVQNETADGIGQSEGVILQKIEKTWDVSAGAFFGNPYDSADYKQSGGSMMGEVEIGENKRLGASLLSAQSHVKRKQMTSVHYRQALSKGSSLMLESGLIQDTPSTGGTTVGSYNFLETWVLLTRGYHLVTAIEKYNAEFKSTAADNWKWSFGFLVFPMPRFELRAEAVNMRSFSGQSASEDGWALQGQIHVSL